mmetsp:Transcript_31021/g.82157  ORF Transcript_31021/g.82157 Transcript_31021/m.82157 type:complete len:297 (+) Transcript_31021:70-960(+)
MAPSSRWFPGLAAAGAVCAAVLVGLMPEPYPDRLARIPESDSRIDNVSPYDSVDKWAANGSQAGLHLLNPYRVSHFDGTIRSLLRPPFRVLDAGCGGGLVSNALAELPDYAAIEGVDLSGPALLFAQRAAAGRNLTHVRFRKASVYALPFDDGAFDAVVMSDVLEHILDLPRALSEVARVLRPGGALVFDTIDRSAISFIVAIIGAEYIVRIINRGSHDWRLFIRPEELQRAAAGAGFSMAPHKAFEPSVRALAELSLFSAGLLAPERMGGGWSIGPPSSFGMISYIGHATKVAGA